jgi:CRP-like cAMP-binding protein
MREAEFLAQLHLLLDTTVVGLNQNQKLGLIRTLCDEAQRRSPEQRPTCRVVPFVTGRRPIDEAAHPGLGSSDSTSLILDQGDPETNTTYILYHIAGLDQYPLEERDAFAIDISLAFAGTDGSQHTLPLPIWNRRPIEPMIFELRDSGKPVLRTIALRELAGENLVIALSPNRDFLPGRHWQWEDVDAQVREGATDGCDPFTFGHLFSQMLYVSLRLTHHGVPVAASQTMIDICDTRRVGSLYQRIIDRLIKPDVERQAEVAGVHALEYTYHPWFPVLLVGSDKATLYTVALVEDIVHKQRHLTDPRWLLRVGLYLEFLTCLGIFEAVKDDIGDLLTPAERVRYEHSPFFAEIRRRLNPQGWRKVWTLRDIMFPRFGVPQTGPVAVLNLLQKKKATLAFLKVHHEDLKHALELAGKNEYNAQETWHRVFRDAERAVLRKTPLAFPELAFLDYKLKDFILWHQKGKTGLRGAERLPRHVSGFFGDQDGLFAAACNQYRASMNEVAAWAKQRGIIDYTGRECIPEQVSLLQAYMGAQETQLERLQHRDGYAATLYIAAKLPDAHKTSAEQIAALLAEVALFGILTEDERRHLATTARKITLGPMERIIIEGRAGTSLFLVGEGRLEVLVRQSDGADKRVDLKQRGDVIGEVSLLTGAPRTATVRAVDGAIVYEIGKQQYELIIKTRPALVSELAMLMEKNVRDTHEQRAAYDSEKEVLAISQRIRRFFFGN